MSITIKFKGSGTVTKGTFMGNILGECRITHGSLLETGNLIQNDNDPRLWGDNTTRMNNDGSRIYIRGDIEYIRIVHDPVNIRGDISSVNSIHGSAYCRYNIPTPKLKRGSVAFINTDDNALIDSNNGIFIIEGDINQLESVHADIACHGHVGYFESLNGNLFCVNDKLFIGESDD